MWPIKDRLAAKAHARITRSDKKDFVSMFYIETNAPTTIRCKQKKLRRIFGRFRSKLWREWNQVAFPKARNFTQNSMNLVTKSLTFEIECPIKMEWKDPSELPHKTYKLRTGMKILIKSVCRDVEVTRTLSETNQQQRQ